MAWSWNSRYDSCKNITFTWLIARLLIQNQRLFQVDYLGQPLRIGHTETMSDRLFFFHVRINFTYLVFSVLVPIQINTNYLLIQKHGSLQKMVNLCLLNHSRGLTGGHAADRHTHQTQQVEWMIMNLHVP